MCFTSHVVKKLNPSDLIRREQHRRRRERRRMGKPVRQGDKQRAALQQLRETYTLIRAPRRLRWQPDQEMVQLLRWLERIRTAALTGEKPAFVDLGRCEEISSIACLMLAAEIERCLRIKPGSVGGSDPKNKNARYLLSTFGFYRLLNIPDHEFPQSPTHVLQIRSGGAQPGAPTENAGALTFEVAELANQVFADEMFADQVHSALNEATDNILSHAYDDEVALADAPPCAPGRWWVAGIGSPKSKRAYFIALDHGATIPVTAPKKFGEGLRAGFNRIFHGSGITLSGALDHQILEATINEKRTRTRLHERGKGLNHMIGLAADSRAGSIWIYSGDARYGYAELEGEAPLEGAEPLGYTFPGTLVIWQVLRPREATEVTVANGADQVG